MIMANVNEVKARLSDTSTRFRAESGCSSAIGTGRWRNSGRWPLQRTAPRPIGGAKGTFTVPPSFFEPLPEDMMDGIRRRDGRPPPAPRGRKRLKARRAMARAPAPAVPRKPRR